MRYRLCHVEELPRGSKKTFTIKKLPIVFIRSQRGAFYAIYGLCPHQRAPLSEGVLGGLASAEQPGEDFRYEREGEIIRCAWHGFSYDVTTGACLAAPDRLRVKTYPAAPDRLRVKTYPLVIEQSEVFLDL